MQDRVLKAKKNCELQLIYVNDIYMEYVGAHDIDFFIGKKDSDFSHNTDENLLHQYYRHECDTLKGNTYSVIQKAIDKSGRTFFILQNKIPFVDNNRNVIGIEISAMEICSTKLINFCNELIIENSGQTHCILHKNKSNEKLSVREQECVFLLLRGFSCAAIAKILNCSKRTIESYLTNIKNKFRVDNKNQLIAYAIENGYIDLCPKRFFNVTTTALLKQAKL